ncbi:MAG: aromatic amino acid aminotransferase, partial [Proteobacteria bacterium]|nr:aromatic amino acid aminotransferase [Pseudomonadota bacterium]
MFEKLKLQPPDAIIGIMGMFRADPAPTKVDLSVGVLQDEAGRTPILECVKRAER